MTPAQTRPQDVRPRHRMIARFAGRALILATLAGACVATTAPTPAVSGETRHFQDARSALSQAATRNFERPPVTDPLTVTVTDAGAEQVTTTAGTVREVLLERGVILGERDFVTPDLSAPLTAGATIVITRPAETTVTETVEIPAPASTVTDPARFEGTETVLQQGVPGTQTTLYTVVTDAAGTELSRALLLTTTSAAPVEHVVALGTKVKPPAPVPAAPAAVAPSTPGAPAAASKPAEPGSNRAIAQDLAAGRGWGADQFVCLDSLWTKESRWDDTAENRSSGAYGIPQALPGSKMASAGADWRTNPATQITWGLGYIAGRYGDPCGAWDHSKARGWY